MSEKILKVLKNDEESEYLMDWWTNSFESRVDWANAEWKIRPASSADEWMARIAEHELEVKKKINMSPKHINDQIVGFESIREALKRGGYECKSFDLLMSSVLFGIDLYNETVKLGINPEGTR